MARNRFGSNAVFLVFFTKCRFLTDEVSLFTQADIARTYGVGLCGGLRRLLLDPQANSTISANSNATAKIIAIDR